MKRTGSFVGIATLGAGLVILGCGSDGAQGPAGPKGDSAAPGSPGTPGAAGTPGSAGTPGTPGAAGAPGVGVGDPQVSAISPARAFLARKAELTISGVATKWSSTTTVDFGAGVTVDKVTAATPDALVVNVTIAATAAPGPRDVVVHDGSATETYKAAFHLDSPISFTTAGALAQASFHPLSSVKMLDVSTPLDPTQNALGVFTNLSATSAGGRLVIASVGVNNNSLAGLLLVDVSATATPQTLTVNSGPATDLTTSPLPAAYTPVARIGMPIGLPVGGATTSVTQTIAAAGDSSLYTVTPTAAVTLHEIAWTGPTGSTRRPLFVLPKSGRWVDAIWGADFSGGLFVGAAPRTGNAFAATHITSTADPFSVIFWNSNTAVGDNTVRLRTTIAASSAAELATATTIATAQALGPQPAAMLSGKVTGDTYAHYVKFTVAAADIGKRVRVITNGDPFCDTVVEVIAPDGTTSLGGPSDDSDYQENWLATAVTVAGDHYVKVTPSVPGPVDLTHTAYNLFIRLE